MPTAPYSAAILEHFRRPRNHGPLPNATVDAEGVNPLCGDRVRVALALDNVGDRIREARFTANACAICVAAASLLTERLRGMNLPLAAALADDEIVLMLGGEIPAARRRCATLPLEAARRAVAIASVSKGNGSGIYSAGAPAAVLLAAGTARRFGGAQKLLAEAPGVSGDTTPLVRQAAAALRRARVERIMVVVGREAVRVRECLAELGLEFVVNEAYEHGMSTSLRTGVAAALARWPDTAGLLIALGDQPLTDDRILPRLIAAFVSSTGARIVAPKYRGVRGNPVIFSRDVEGELAAITGDRGAREVIERDPARVHHVDFDTAPPVDVDTPGDLERLARELPHRER